MKRRPGRVLLLLAVQSAAAGLRLHRQRAGERTLPAAHRPRATRPWPRATPSAAIEAFSGAIALKPDSMVGYLKRGEAYRRRGRARRRAAGPAPRPPSSTRPPPRPLELLGDVNYAAAPLRSRRGRALSGVRRRSTTVAARALQAGARALPSRPARRGDRRAAAGARARRRGSPRRTTCSASASATRSSRGGAGGARTRDRSCARRCCRRAKSWPISTARWDGPTSGSTQLEALRALDPGAVARASRSGLAYARAGQPDRAVLTLRQRRRAVSRPSVHLRRARPRVARDRAGARRPRRAEQGARGARRRPSAATTAARR